MDTTYYLYRHVRLDTNEVFYIGIGHYNTYKPSYKRAKTKSKRNRYWNNIVNKTEYKVDILFESDSELLIKEKEIEFINLYGRVDKKNGSLVNLTDGGDGTSNYSEDRLNKHIDLMVGNKFRVGVKHDTNTINKIKDTLSNFYNSPDSLSVKEKSRQRMVQRNKNSIKKINQINPITGEIIKTWDSAESVANNFNVTKSSIHKRVKKGSGCGYIWEYA